MTSTMHFRSRLGAANAVVSLTVVLSLVPTAHGQLGYEKPPINYGSVAPNDAVASLAASIEAGDVSLSYDDTWGWLPSILEQLAISPDSQTLVFSKTSLQLHKISPRAPRAVYFSDEVYVGWCQNGDVLELAATDPDNGAMFYTIDQNEFTRPTISRDRGQCLTCHATHRTQGVPGFLVRSIFSDNNGRPRSGTRTYVTDHSTPMENRFGGWYVTGEHGSIRHMGNVIASDRSNPESLERDAGANLSSLEELIDTTRYLRSSSDIAALMVLEHQSQMHNLIARASMETRIARYYDRGINEALSRPLDTMSPSTVRRIESAGEDLLRYLFFCEEQSLESPIVASPAFLAAFGAGPRADSQRDSQGRSLRDFDLQTRLLKYRCSYLIYSQAFDALPEPMAKYIRRRMREILLNDLPSERAVTDVAKAPNQAYEHLTSAEKRAIVEILAETKPGYL